MVSVQQGWHVSAARIVLGCTAVFILVLNASAQSAPADGRALFSAERKGNCSACHKTPTDTSLKGVSNIGPPLESIKQKYPAPADRTRLRDAIRDSGKFVPATVMPPYGKHRILTEAEIDAIVTYLETL